MAPRSRCMGSLGSYIALRSRTRLMRTLANMSASFRALALTDEEWVQPNQSLTLSQSG
ncbi:hypothetical protein E2C01_066962 [Portunus trituberculatus]|uniref:Uncharacterized protein n=1 Tax=Portunus trituberculatus TaxID=210409 RepID=A0A5B7HSC4_PORTR|nr:hypothetical protein [Portunus trituberculatus]